MVRAVSWSWFRGTDCSAITLLFENIGWRFSVRFWQSGFREGKPPTSGKWPAAGTLRLSGRCRTPLNWRKQRIKSETWRGVP